MIFFLFFYCIYLTLKFAIGLLCEFIAWFYFDWNNRLHFVFFFFDSFCQIILPSFHIFVHCYYSNIFISLYNYWLLSISFLSFCYSYYSSILLIPLTKIERLVMWLWALFFLFLLWRQWYVKRHGLSFLTTALLALQWPLFCFLCALIKTKENQENNKILDPLKQYVIINISSLFSCTILEWCFQLI